MPIARGAQLARVVNCALNREICRNVPPSTNQGSQVAGVLGVGPLLTTSAIKVYQTGSITVGTGDFTLALVYELKTAEVGGYAYMFGTNQGAEGIAFATRHSSTSSNADILLAGTHINTGILASAAGTYRVVISRKAGQLAWSINGKTGSAANNANLPAFSAIALNSYLDAAGYGASSAVYNLVAFLPYAVDVNTLADNPWAVFAPRRHALYINQGAGGASNISGAGSAQSSGTANLAAQVALAGIGVSLAGGQASAAVAVPLSAAGIAVAGGAADAKATITLSAAGLAQAAGQAGLSAAVLLAGAGAAQAAGNAALAAQLNALAAGAAQAGGTANLVGGAPGALSGVGNANAAGSAALAVSVGLQATGAAQAGGSAAGQASAPGALSAAGSAIAGGYAQWSTLITLTAAGFVQAMGTGSLKIDVQLAAQGAGQSAGQAGASLAGLVRNFRLLQSPPQRLTRCQSGVTRQTILHTEVTHGL